MKKLLYYMMTCIQVLLLSACDSYESPETPVSAQLHLCLNYETDMTLLGYHYNGVSVVEQGMSKTYDNRQADGKIRYIVRVYPASEKQHTSQNCIQEFVFTKDIAQGYNHEVTLDIAPGSYNIMVWSDLIHENGDSNFYDANNFAEIKLQGDHQGNTDYRDAFRGTSSITLTANRNESLADTLHVAMQRPLAKFEFITTDLKKFVDKELEYLADAAATRGSVAPTQVDMDNYRVVFRYAGYMPDTYNMNTDKPIDASTGVCFESKLNIQNENEASLGFDYVSVNDKETGVSVQIGLYDNEGRQVALSDPIDVPLLRSHHTVLTGSFLLQQASGGININPDFDGNHNIVIQ